MGKRDAYPAKSPLVSQSGLSGLHVSVLFRLWLLYFGVLLISGCGEKALNTEALETGCGEVEAIPFNDLTDHWGGSPIGLGGAYYTGTYPMGPRYLELLLESGDSLIVDFFKFEIELDSIGYKMEFRYYEQLLDGKWGTGFRFFEVGTWEYDSDAGKMVFTRSENDPVMEGTPISFSSIFLDKQPELSCCVEMSWNNSSDGDDWLILKNISGIEQLREVRLKRFTIDF